MRRVIPTVLVWALCASYASAVRELVIVEEPQPAQRVQGVVLDPSGEPIPGMTVTDRTDDGVAVLRSTKTDAKGRFHFHSVGRVLTAYASITRCGTHCRSGSSSTSTHSSAALRPDRISAAKCVRAFGILGEKSRFAL